MTPIALRRLPCCAPRSTLARRAGLTLIEVAIAMVVFVIGALAIIQIFPPLLGAIQNSESRTIASRLADSTLSRLHDNPDLIPDAIYNDDGSGNFVSPGFTVTGTASLNESLPDEPRGFDASALSKFKRIVGERHTVLDGTSDFVLTQFPYEEGTVRVYVEDEVYGVTVSSSGKLDFSNAYTNSIASFRDGDVNHSDRPPVSARSDDGVTFYISYRWVDGGIQGVIEEPKTFSEDSGWTDGDPTNSNGLVIAGLNGHSVIAGPVSVRYRALQTLTSAPSADQAKRGYLPLNPISAGTEISVDYTVRDWRWLVDERVLDQPPEPTTEAAYVSTYTTPRYVRLPARNVETEPQLQIFGLIWDRSSGSTPYAVSSGIVPQTDAENGLAYYEANGLTAPRVRTIYQTVDNWTHQLSVAARSYVPYVEIASRPVTAPRERWREYDVGADPDNAAQTALFFRSGEAGKTVAVSYQYVSGGVTTQVQNRVVTIRTQIDAAPATVAASFTADSPQVAYATLPVADATILSVRGLSIRARTAWLNGDRWTQTVLTGYRPQ